MVLDSVEVQLARLCSAVTVQRFIDLGRVRLERLAEIRRRRVRPPLGGVDAREMKEHRAQRSVTWKVRRCETIRAFDELAAFFQAIFRLGKLLPLDERHVDEVGCVTETFTY